MSLRELFPDRDQAFAMRFNRAPPQQYFAPGGQHAAVIAERRQWLRQAPGIYAGLLPDGVPLLEETVRLASLWCGFVSPDAGGALDLLRALGGFWEPDFLLLKPGDDGEFRLLGGCLCFPSHWRLADKIGRPVSFIHAPVPGLNEALGASIQKFLAGIKPGVAWQRSNWGLSRSPEMNQHPDRALPRLDGTVRLEEVWLRVEEQALVSLPESGGILFCIRICNHPLSEIRANAPLAGNFSRALRTMPESLAAYKGLTSAQEKILELVRA